MRTLCKLRVGPTEIDAWVHLSGVPTPNCWDNVTRIVLPVGEDEETEWIVCGVRYFGHPEDPGAAYVQVLTKPLTLSAAEKYQPLIDDIKEKFQLEIEIDDKQ